MSRPETVVTGIGLVTPAGVGTEQTWEAVVRGLPTAATSPDLQGLPVDFCCSVPPFDARRVLGARKAWRLDRHVILALTAAQEAVDSAALRPDAWDGPRVAVVMGCSFGGAATWQAAALGLRDHGVEQISPVFIPRMMVNGPAAEIALALGARGPSMATATACASGADAIATGRALLLADACDIVLAGGAEAVNCTTVVAGFHRMGALSSRRDDPAAASRPFAADRDGFVLSEAAAVLVLEREVDARARGATPRAVMAGCASATDAHHPTAPHPEGRGAQEALGLALRGAGLTASQVDHVNAHGTSTVVNDAVEAGVIGRTLPHGPSVTSAKGVLGHSLGAAGAVEAALTVLTIERSLAPPLANLAAADPSMDVDLVIGAARTQSVGAAVSHSFGFGGHNTVLAFRRA
ncbi:beta-ketoacyl-[acyl-carrier-protein] synthase family protein [Streptomyces sp. NPDC003032]